jgi:hypothetical protein
MIEIERERKKNRNDSDKNIVKSFLSYLAKLLKAADCGFIQSGTRPVCSCSAINLCISSVVCVCVGIVVNGWNEARGRKRERIDIIKNSCKINYRTISSLNAKCNAMNNNNNIS